MKAKIVKESIKDVLIPKSKTEIFDNFVKTYGVLPFSNEGFIKYMENNLSWNGAQR